MGSTKRIGKNSVIEDYYFITEEEFEQLDSEQKWNYVTSLVKIIEDLDIQAEKNCAECEKTLIDEGDVNVDLYFEDWRECRDHCDECGKEERIYMCDLQFNVVSHLANELLVLRRRQNALANLFLRKNGSKPKILEELEKAEKNEERRKKDSNGMIV